MSFQYKDDSDLDLAMQLSTAAMTVADVKSAFRLFNGREPSHDEIPYDLIGMKPALTLAYFLKQASFYQSPHFAHILFLAANKILKQDQR